MGRPANSVETTELKLRTTPMVVGYLEALVATGLWGKNRAEAAERLVVEGIRALLREGTLGEAVQRKTEQ